MNDPFTVTRKLAITLRPGNGNKICEKGKVFYCGNEMSIKLAFKK